MALTGFIVFNGAPSCVSSAQQAMEVLSAGFPFFGGSAPSMCSLNSIALSGGSVFTENITCSDLSSGTSATFSHSVNLMACDPSLGIAGLNVFDPVVAGSFFTFALVSVFFVYLISRNAQAILDAIKKF